jgi:hypothetical protein
LPAAPAAVPSRPAAIPSANPRHALADCSHGGNVEGHRNHPSLAQTMNYRLRAALAPIPMLLLLSATLCALADDTVNVTLEYASAWFAMTEMPAQAYARAHAVWRQWLKHWHLTGDPRALRTALVCGQIAEEKLAAWQAGAVAPQMQPSRYRDSICPWACRPNCRLLSNYRRPPGPKNRPVARRRARRRDAELNLSITARPFTVDPVPAPGAAPVAFRDEFDGGRIRRGLRWPSGCLQHPELGLLSAFGAADWPSFVSRPSFS